MLEDAFALLDTDGDDALSLAEITARIALPPAVFRTIDGNGDGLITWDEIDAVRGRMNQDPDALVTLARRVAGRFGGQFFQPGEPVRVTLRLAKRGAGLLRELRLVEMLPEGWTLGNLIEAAGGSLVKAGVAENALVLTWANVVPFPLEIVYEAVPPSENSGAGTLTGQADYVTGDGAAFSTGIVPTILAEALSEAMAHSADTNRDWRIALNELLRVVQLYNAGAYHGSDGTEDGFAPGPGGPGARFHSGDLDSNWNFSISELLRVVQLFNSRSGAYYVAEGTEDGYIPGVY
ncbi:MAG: EF-hand domain-containing protein [Candidatus Hydrogenedentes bacterium]|nr:EF-hand domain-containing protein [Candidatus Hydrogenedentota bacterium]